ncbi:heme NO-binding domain-containing protein [Carboxylicivirga linearis]|uniref:Heme NO-binding domain-containing protein n=1 Tax=Carboxylicivirga linearis TaxID=1628157 RepID=A0ABS5JZQ1_9BACT|nr:heme NO-binding domain-containing protein [Carboxylicivirga linearis]MBS2099886.1 heme NO-binding domain-containing protein [Carboxylicivirga linearis]
MKGVIIDCLRNLVSKEFGTDQWSDILVDSGLKPNETILSTIDFDDKTAISLIHSTCKVLNLSIEQAAEAFGDYWMNYYASKIYSAYMAKANSAKELLLMLDNIHLKVTKSMPNARPPKFSYDWKDDSTLVMTYISDRNLIDIFIGLVKSVGKFYNENLKITKGSNNEVIIKFL